MAKTVEQLTAGLKLKLSKSVGYTMTPLDARFTVVRTAESNLANFVCDVMRFYYSTDCAVMAGGTMRGDTVYPPGEIKLGDLVNCFPFEDPVVVIRVSGASIVKALENGVSKLPAQEGRFPQVSNIKFSFDTNLPEGSRVSSAFIGNEPIVPEKQYTMATRGELSIQDFLIEI